MRACIKDIAKKAKLHPSTVGDILRNRKECYASIATKKRVQRIAKEMNYRRNMSAVALKTNRSHMIGLIGNCCWEPHLAKLLSLLSQELLKSKFALEVHVSESGSVEDGLKAAYSRPADAIVDVAYYSPERGSFTEHLLQVGYPLISVLCNQDVEGDFVTVDILSAMHDIVEYLIGLGHRRIACCTYHGNNEEKQIGFLRAMNAFGINVPKSYLNHVPGTFEDGYKFGGKILIGPDHPTVYFLHNDVAALGFIRSMADRGLRVPEDVGVVGFNGDESGSFSIPRITSAQFPLEDIAEQTVKLVLGSVNMESRYRQNSDFTKIILPAPLVIGDSVKAI